MIALVALATACGGPDGNDTHPASDADPASDAAPAADAAPAQDVQVVQVTVQGNTYVFSPASVHAEQSVRLVFDPNALPGCSSSVTLPDYDITKTIAEGDATIEFTPHGEGPITVACSMNMFTGTLLAE
jgi:plastocyanin domain-containing protein